MTSIAQRAAAAGWMFAGALFWACVTLGLVVEFCREWGASRQPALLTASTPLDSRIAARAESPTREPAAALTPATAAGTAGTATTRAVRPGRTIDLGRYCGECLDECRTESPELEGVTFIGEVERCLMHTVRCAETINVWRTEIGQPERAEHYHLLRPTPGTCWREMKEAWN